jgi:hypothetical protein
MADKKTVISSETVFRKSADVIERQLEGEAVLLDLKTGIYYSLDPVGSRVWELVDGSKSLDSIARLITGEYDIGHGQALEDMRELMADLLDEGLVAKG